MDSVGPGVLCVGRGQPLPLAVLEETEAGDGHCRPQPSALGAGDSELLSSVLASSTRGTRAWRMLGHLFHSRQFLANPGHGVKIFLCRSFHTRGVDDLGDKF